MTDEVSHNGKENPIGIETYGITRMRRNSGSHNGKENPIGIETGFQQFSLRRNAESQWKRKPDRD